MHKQRPDSGADREAPYYFTVAELAHYSRIGVNTLYRALRNRELRHACVGQKKIIARKDFESWLRKKTKMSLDEFPRAPFELTSRAGHRGEAREKSGDVDGAVADFETED